MIVLAVQFVLFAVLLLKRPRWIKSFGHLLVDLASCVEGRCQHRVPRRGAGASYQTASSPGDDPPRVRLAGRAATWRTASSRPNADGASENHGQQGISGRATRKGGLSRLEESGSKLVLSDLTSALVGLGCKKGEARRAAALAVRSGMQDFDGLLRAAVQSARAN